LSGKTDQIQTISTSTPPKNLALSSNENILIVSSEKDIDLYNVSKIQEVLDFLIFSFFFFTFYKIFFFFFKGKPFFMKQVFQEGKIIQISTNPKNLTAAILNSEGKVAIIDLASTSIKQLDIVSNVSSGLKFLFFLIQFFFFSKFQFKKKVCWDNKGENLYCGLKNGEIQIINKEQTSILKTIEKVESIENSSGFIIFLFFFLTFQSNNFSFLFFSFFFY